MVQHTCTGVQRKGDFSPCDQDLSASLKDAAVRVESTIASSCDPEDRVQLTDLAQLLRRAAFLAMEGDQELVELLLARACRMPAADRGDFGIPFVPLRWEDLDAEIDRAEAYRREEIRRAPYRRRAAAPFEFTPETIEF